MIIFVNSEKYQINDKVEEIKFSEIIKLSGYPIDQTYIIIDEHTSEWYVRDRVIKVKPNMSLMIKKVIK